MGHHPEQDLLGRVLGVGEGAQHPQGKVEHQVLDAGQHLLQRRPVPGGGPLHQQAGLFIRVHKKHLL